MPTLPFKLNQDRRQHIPKQKHKETNWREYDTSLRQRGSLTVWFSAEAIEGWGARHRVGLGLTLIGTNSERADIRLREDLPRSGTEQRPLLPSSRIAAPKAGRLSSGPSPCRD